MGSRILYPIPTELIMSSKEWKKLQKAARRETITFDTKEWKQIQKAARRKPPFWERLTKWRIFGWHWAVNPITRMHYWKKMK